MREIKFRAWVNGSMWLVNGLACSDDSCVLMQYTGVKDKNGKEIYEGDIVETELGKGIVVFDSTAFLVRNLDDEYYGFDDFFSLYKGGCYLVEVIGNIYENPELLEVNEQ